MSTEKLYYEDAYIKDFSAKVISIESVENNLFDIILDKTAFFPESGGQDSDYGIIKSFPVSHVRIEDDTVIHRISCKDSDIQVGESVDCHIDFTHRFSNMQQHTGEHIFSGLVHSYFGYENTGFHLSENTVTMDYSGKLSVEDIKKIEYLSNKAITDNLPVTAYFPEPDELNSIHYRAKLEAEEMGNVRIVTIGNVDICACCAPHVKSTGEVGLLKVTDCESHKAGVRLSIVCGDRALSDYVEKHNLLTGLSQNLSAPIDELPVYVDRLKQEITTLSEKLRLSEEKILNLTTASLDKDIPILFTEISDGILLRNTVNRLRDKSLGTAFAFNGNDKNGYNFIIASKKDDAVNILHRLSELIDIKGGGSPAMVQGKTSCVKADILSAITQQL